MEEKNYLEIINELEERNDLLTRVNCRLMDQFSKIVGMLNDSEICNLYKANLLHNLNRK